METSIYQKLLYIYYLEYAIHHNSLSIPSHFLLFCISSSPSLCDVVFTTSSSIVLHILIPPSYFTNQ